MRTSSRSWVTLSRKNLTRDEVKMLQIRSVRPKYDKHSGALNGHNINLSTPKYAWDGMGGKYARYITVCDHKGQYQLRNLIDWP